MANFLNDIIFKTNNPESDVARCPNGRAKMRKPLDAYAKAATNLYGIIDRDELAEIFNSQNEEQTTGKEIYTLLLPNVLKSRPYAFYEDYIVHKYILDDFGILFALLAEQADKPRFIPPKDEFLGFNHMGGAGENRHWLRFRMFVWDIFGYSPKTVRICDDIRDYVVCGNGIQEFEPIANTCGLAFTDRGHLHKFFDLLLLAKNNTRIWPNNGYTPLEMHDLLKKKYPMRTASLAQPDGSGIYVPKKLSADQLCPCGSRKKYKMCCALTEKRGTAQLSQEGREMFYRLWYKLLDYVNTRLGISSRAVQIPLLRLNDDASLRLIRDAVWERAGLIAEFADNGHGLSDDEADMLRSWHKYHLRRRFAVVKYKPEYAIFLSMEKNPDEIKPYAVKGITTSICNAMQRPLPFMLETVLLPFGNTIVYDTILEAFSVDFGEGIMEMFDDEYTKAKDRYGLITDLREPLLP
ncbi:MAG: SEC-C domain-containing protein [Clostridiales Family XIII bacterium]|jgi:hypothetical protein|nr:SEC-C domain-containing protein [Clostridiales Family XIII bacterium]